MRDILHLASAPTIARIQRETCAEHGVTIEAMLGKRRDAKVVQARHEAVRRAYKETQISLNQIGRAFLRHHCTILYVIGRLNRRARLDKINRTSESGPKLILAVGERQTREGATGTAR